MTKLNDIDEETQKLRLSDPDLRAEANSDEGQQQPTTTADVPRCPVTGATADGKTPNPHHDYRFIPLRMGGNGGTHKVSDGSASLIDQEVSLEQLTAMTNSFYDKAFQDVTLDKFIRSHDDPHGPRFAKWIHQKLSGSQVWDEDRATRNKTPVTIAGGRQAVVYDRSSAHAAAWYSPKRPARDVGRHFKLDECRVWMRLHFWALRDSGVLDHSPSFADYYVRFIGHFVRIYESTAPIFARDSFRWSADPKNIRQYLDNGRRMSDVLGVSYERAINELPEEEANDLEWPYNHTPQPIIEPQAW